MHVQIKMVKRHCCYGVNAVNGVAGGGESVGEADGVVPTPSVEITYDNAVSGLVATNVQGAIDEVVADVTTAAEVTYDNATSGLVATNAQDAIDEVHTESLAKRGALADLNSAAGRVMGIYDVDFTASGLPSDFPSFATAALLFTTVHSTLTGHQRLVTADRETSSTYTMEWSRNFDTLGQYVDWKKTFFQGWVRPTLTASTNYVATAADVVIGVTAAAAKTVTLPVVFQELDGRRIEVSNKGAGTCSVAAPGLINGSNSDYLLAQWETAVFQAFYTGDWVAH